MPSAPRPSRFQRARDGIEAGFSRWGEICHDHPWWIVICISAAIAYFSTFLPNIQADMSTEGYLRENDPARLVYDQFQREFGRDERIVVLVQSDGDIINEDFLSRLKTWHETLEALPQVDKVDSLINARMTIGRDDELIVQDLLQDWPQTAKEFETLRERIKSNPLYRNHFVNSDLTETMMIVTPDTYTASHSAPSSNAELDEFDFDSAFDDVENLDATHAQTNAAPAADAQFITEQEIYALIDRIRPLARQIDSPDFHIGIAGSPFMMHQLTFILGRDMFVFSGIGIIIISILLFAIFRRWVMVILPVLVAALSVYFTFALIAFFNITVTGAVQILPSLVLAVGVGNSVHIFTAYFQAVDEGKDKRQALSYALGHSGLAVLMTGLTTAGGLISFISANMKPVADIGIVCPIGILCTLLFSLLLLPALISIARFKDKGLRDDKNGLLQRFLSRCADLSTGYPKRVVFGWMGLLALCLFLVAQIRPSHDPMRWFPEGTEVRDTAEAIDDAFGGATFMEIVVDSGKPNGLHDPQLLHSVDDALEFADNLEVEGVRFGKSTSLIEIIKELHQALNGNDPTFYAVPDDRALIAQELLLFENSGSDDLDDIVDTQFSKMRITAKMPFANGMLYPNYLDKLTAGIHDIIGDKATLTYTGIVKILASSVKLLITDTIRAYMIAFLIIAPLMMLLVGSVRTGLICMIPNLAPIIVTLAFMGFMGIPLDAFTLLVGSIALGLAVDDTIHFMHNYQRYYAKFGDSAKAVRETLRTTGKALMITSVVLSAAFFINMLGTMVNVKAFGLLTGFCIIVAFLADVLLAPALMMLLAQWKDQKFKDAIS